MLSATPSGHVYFSFQRPNLDSNQDQDLRTVLCCPLHHRDVLPIQSRRLDSHQHLPVYRTGAFLSRATSASSTSARSRKSVRQFWRLAALPGAHSCRVKSSRPLEPGAIVVLLLR